LFRLKGELIGIESECKKAFKELGFDIPKTEDQLKSFNEKFKDYPHRLTGKEINPKEIWGKANPL